MAQLNLSKDKNFIASARISASKGLDMNKIFNVKYIKGEVHISLDVSGATWSIKLNNSAEGKYIEKQLKKINPNPKKEPNLEEIKFIVNYIIENNEEINNMKAFKKAIDRLQKFRAEGYYD